MSGRRISAALGAAVVVAALAGCGNSGTHVPDVSKLPLVPGASIELQERVCDSGSNPYCGWEMVVTSTRYRDADEMFSAEHRLLGSRHWSGADAGSDGSHAAESPDGKLRVTYATPYEDLVGTEINGVRRTQQITLALSKAAFDHTPALSILLELGSS
jgi:hypothetical protein